VINHLWDLKGGKRVIVKAIVKRNAYYDSVTLMVVSKKVKEIDGVANANVSMATEMNKVLLENVGLMTTEVEAAGPNDLVIAFKVADETTAVAVVGVVEEALKKKFGGGNVAEVNPASIASAVKLLPEANLAIISVPGQYAAKEAMAALKKGLHVMIFSDNVSIEDEVALKKYAHQEGLLVMGPDCGTAMITNKGLCFANEVSIGNIGVVGASGTGTQEVMVLIDRLGGGISQAIGTGGRDLSEAVGGIMMCDVLAALNRDDNTEVILLVSKPPVKAVSDIVLAEVQKCNKPVVICFIDSDINNAEGAGIYFERTLEGAAHQAVSLAQKAPIAVVDEKYDQYTALINQFQNNRTAKQQYVRGLFCGGTLCDEARYVFKDALKGDAKVYSNVAKDAKDKLPDPLQSMENSFVDLGDDVFTVGKPHPMIDPSLRSARIIQEAKDDSVAVILLDVVLGYGSHRDPAGITVAAIKEARSIAAKDGRQILFIAYVCGTDRDLQSLSAQEAKLAEAGVVLAKSNAKAARLAAAINGGEKI
jgi:FdrA protein